MLRGAIDGRILVSSPESFEVLAAWVGALDRYALDRDGSSVRDAMRSRPLASVAKYLDGLDPLRELPRAAAQCATPAALGTRLHTWFDSFRTLKLLHALRDAGAPDVELAEALSSAGFVGKAADGAHLVEIESRLCVSVGPACLQRAFSPR